MITSSFRPSREEVRSLLSDLVSIDSINPSLVPGGGGEKQIAGYVANWLEQAGVGAVELHEIAPDRPNVIGRVKGRSAGRTLMLNAHVDTVGIAGMSQPLVARAEGDRLYGRGAYDMKGGLAAIMLAAGRLASSSEFEGELIVTAVADEEYASLGTQAVVSSLSADAAIVTEPTGLRICSAHKGFAWLSIETNGRAAHGSRADLGIDAISHMGRVLASIESVGGELARRPPHPLLGTASLHASSIEGGGELSSYPAHCRLQLERRTLPGETPDSVLAEIENQLAKLSLADPTFSAHAELFFWRDSFEVARDEEVVRAVDASATEIMGAHPRVYGDTPWMDAALLSAAGIPTVVFGPGGAGAHAAEEYGNLEEVAVCAQILAKTAITFCRSR